MENTSNARILQFDFANDQTSTYWKDQIIVIPETNSIFEEISLIRNFSALLYSGKLEEMKNQRIETGPNFEKEFIKNVTTLKSEILSLYTLNQNIFSLVIEKNASQNFHKKYVDREKTGLKMFDIKVNKNIATEDDTRDSIIGMKDFRSSIELKTTVL